ncbi:MAG: hypothetical protein WBF58_21565 [Xanthobacteraceae bacterium]
MTTKPLARFWKALDEIPEATTDRRDWSLRLKDDWPAAESYLAPVGRRAKEIACPSPGGDGCPRKIVKHSDGRFRAVCGNKPAECEPIEVTGEEITCLTLDRKKLAAAVGAILSATPAPGARERGAVMLVGSHAVAAGIGIPIVLMIPGPMAEVSLEILPELDGPAAIVIPTPGSVLLQFKTALKSRGHTVLALSEIGGVDDQHRLTGLQPAETLLSPLRERLLAGQTSTASGRIWVLPADARWEDLRFEFTDREVVNIRFRQETRRFEPEQFGMKSAKNGRPTTLWTLLWSIADLEGSLTWKDRAASTKVKKRKQLLSNRLASLFGIQGDPIPWRPNQRAYVARFTIRDSTPDNGRARNGRR